MGNRKYYVFMPDSQSAMMLNEILKKENIKSTLVPTPREAAHCCGVSILYSNLEDMEKINQIALKVNISIDGFWNCDNKDDPNRNRFC